MSKDNVENNKQHTGGNFKKLVSESKTIYNYKSHITAEILAIYSHHKKNLGENDITLINDNLNTVNDLTIDKEDMHPLLKDCIKAGQEMIEDFNTKNPGFFENKPDTEYTSTTNLILSVLQQTLRQTFLQNDQDQNAVSLKQNNDESKSESFTPKPATNPSQPLYQKVQEQSTKRSRSGSDSSEIILTKEQYENLLQYQEAWKIIKQNGDELSYQTQQQIRKNCPTLSSGGKFSISV